MTSISVFRFGDRQTPPFEIHVLPLHTELLSSADPGMNTVEESRYMFRIALSSVFEQDLLFLIREETNSAIALDLLLELGY